MKQFKLTLVLTVLMSMVGLQAFADWNTSTKVQVNGLYYYLDNDNFLAQVTSKSSGYYTGDIEIPFDFIYAGNIYSVTNIGDYAFSGCSSLTSVTIGNSVTSIGNEAFRSCSGLTSITIPNSVMSIGEKAFSNCTKLTSLKVESGNTKFDSRDNCNAIIETASNKLIAGCNTTVIPNSVTSIGQDAFRGSGLTGVIIPNSVTSIGSYAFNNCSALTSVTLNSNDIVSKEHTYSDNIKTIFGNQVKKYVIGDDVTSIGDNAFYGCTGITSFTIGNNVTSIGYMAFYGCTGLATFTIPYKVTSIGAYAFRDCSALESLTIDRGVTSYGNSAFQCSKLTSVTVLNPTPVAITQNVFTNRTNATLYVPTGCKNAYESADYWKEFKEIKEKNIVVVVDGLYYNLDYVNNQAQVTSMPEGKYTGDIVIPSSFTYNDTNYSVTSIGDYAFYDCSGPTSVTIPNSVTSIGDYAFRGCSGLTSVTIGNSVTSIGNDAFSSCSGLTSITIPNSVTSIGDWAFYKCTGLTSLTIGSGVTSIGDYAFEGCSGLTSITIPNRVTSIGGSAFSDCSGLTSITIPNSVTSIGSYAFYNTAWYNNQPDGLIYAGKVVYNYKGTMPANTSISIKDGTLGIAGNAFYKRSGLTSITIPSSVTSIGRDAFDYCSGLTSVTLNSNDVVSKAYASSNNMKSIFGKQVTEYVIGDDVTAIGEFAFSNCSSLTSVTIGSGVTSIGRNAFQYCSGITSVTINSSSILSNGNYMIDYFGNQVEEYIIGNNVTSIGNNAFSGCKGLTSITIPNSVTSIGNNAFRGCSGLTAVTIPNSVTSIGNGAFWGCSGLTSVTIPNSVTSIGGSAFEGCSKLTSVTALNPTPVAITEYVFTNRTNATLYVPKGSKSAYQAADYWKGFKEIIEIEVTGIDQISFQENGEQGIDQEGAVWYTIDGKQMDKPKKGINIIRMKNGTTKKVVVK